MSVNQNHAQVVTDHPRWAKTIDGPDLQTATTRIPPAAHADQNQDSRQSSDGQAPWAVRHARWVLVGILLLVTAALTYTFSYYMRSAFGPNPIDGIATDAINRAGVRNTAEAANAPATIGSIQSMSTTDRLQQALDHANSLVAAPIAPIRSARQQSTTADQAVGSPTPMSARSTPTLGALRSPVTHTHPLIAAPVAPSPAANQATAAIRPAETAASAANEQAEADARTNARQDQTGSFPCTKSVAALGLCAPQANVDGK